MTVAFLALALAACGIGNNRDMEPGTGDAVASVADGISRCAAAEGLTLYGITDREGMQATDLFRGYDDRLLDSIAADQGGFRSAFNVFVAQNEGRIVLFDAGLGQQAGGTLVAKLKTMGLTPDAIGDICLTHLHFDHIGGLVHEGKAVFPNATLHLDRRECAAWADDARWQQVLAAYDGRVQTFAADTALFNGLVQTRQAYGHTPGHTLYEVGNCLIVGDLLHAQDLQLSHPDFCSHYDADHNQARAVRKQTYRRLRESGQYLCGAHCYDHFIDLQ